MSVTLKQKYDLYKKVRANPDISDAGKVLFEYLLRQCLNCTTLKCHPGAETIMKDPGWRLRKVRKVLAELKKAGVLRWKSGRTGWSNEYYFPGLAVTATDDRNVAVTERNAVTESTGCRTTSADIPVEFDEPNRAPTGVKSCTHPVSNRRGMHWCRLQEYRDAAYWSHCDPAGVWLEIRGDPGPCQRRILAGLRGRLRK
jgi:hypothetical protein